MGEGVEQTRMDDALAVHSLKTLSDVTDNRLRALLTMLIVLEKWTSKGKLEDEVV